MIVPDPVNLTRPYTCVDCGGEMRTRGIDGRCISCMSTPTVVCAGYISDRGSRVSCGRVAQAGGGRVEEGICAPCASAQARAQERRRAREGRELLRSRALGYGADPDAVDWEELRRGE